MQLSVSLVGRYDKVISSILIALHVLGTGLCRLFFDIGRFGGMPKIDTLPLLVHELHIYLGHFILLILSMRKLSQSPSHFNWIKNLFLGAPYLVLLSAFLDTRDREEIIQQMPFKYRILSKKENPIIPNAYVRYKSGE
ncbi:uncharacterized protein BDR25DRAFT_360207 [Lindgomyces ingoldianus]|uniref:Uncharacterized protein n=1 Tax=Lindgomyces ingoldianus TaxID=673940 RepID=A0ACB6QHT3_9PLEO|nr:uncharacterized protein BDR25DRAFT_360207 [Lindgomyces ingoldianus]KAF2465682.1 hypothetical protein BDR25DRAFT_360207 [Lindgomyces ingoldianus]